MWFMKLIVIFFISAIFYLMCYAINQKLYAKMIVIVSIALLIQHITLGFVATREKFNSIVDKVYRNAKILNDEDNSNFIQNGANSLYEKLFGHQPKKLPKE